MLIKFHSTVPYHPITPMSRSIKQFNMTNLTINQPRLEEFSELDRKIYQLFLKKYFGIQRHSFGPKQPTSYNKEYLYKQTQKEIESLLNEREQLNILHFDGSSSAETQLCYAKDLFGDSIRTIMCSNYMPIENKYTKKIDDWIVSTMEFLPLELTNNIDVITLLGTQFRIPYDPLKVISEISRVLRPGSKTKTDGYYDGKLFFLLQDHCQELEKILIENNLDNPNYRNRMFYGLGESPSLRFFDRKIFEFHDNFPENKKEIEKRYNVEIKFSTIETTELGYSKSQLYEKLVDNIYIRKP